MFILKKNSTFWTCMFFYKKKREKNPHFKKTFYPKLEWSQKVEIGKI